MKSATPFFSSSTYCQKVRKFSLSSSLEKLNFSKHFVFCSCLRVFNFQNGAGKFPTTGWNIGKEMVGEDLDKRSSQLRI